MVFTRKVTVTISLFLLLLIVLSLPAASELFKPGYFTSHDGGGHIIRFQEFHIALRDGHFPPRLSKNLMYGYGYYFFNFNYPLIHWSGELFHLLGFGFVDSVKAVSILGLILSSLTMFLWQRAHWGNWGGLVAGVLYMYAPYRLLNVYVRGALAEHLAFIMLPLLFMFTEKIIEGEPAKRLRYIILGGVSYALLLLSHNIMAFIFTLVLGLFMLFHLLLYKKLRNLLSFAAVGLSGLALSAFFWVPSLIEKKLVRLDQTIGRDYPDHFVYIQQLWQRSWGYGDSGPGPGDDMSFQIGIYHLLFTLLAVFLLPFVWKKYRAKALHILFYLVIFVLSVFFMLEISKPLWDSLPLLRFTQFPWRFLSWTVFATSVLGGAVTFLVAEKVRKPLFLAPILVLLLLGLVIQSNKDYWKPNQRIHFELPGDRPIPGSTTSADEQLPIWFDPKPTEPPSSKVEIVEGEGTVEIEVWKTAFHTYRVLGETPVRVVENTAYYPGWKLKINGEGQDFTFQDKEYRGRIVYKLPEGEYQITTTFEETPLRQTANLISLLSSVFVSGILIHNLRRPKKT